MLNNVFKGAKAEKRIPSVIGNGLKVKKWFASESKIMAI